jgi:hypothetical protein
MSEVERKAYDELSALCGQRTKAAANSQSTKGGNMSILTVLLQLRIFCNTSLSSPVQKFSDDVEEHPAPDKTITLLQQSGEAVCVSCNTELLFLDSEVKIESYRNLSHRRLKCEGCSRRAPGTNDAEGFSRDCQNPHGTAPVLQSTDSCFHMQKNLRLMKT